MSYTLQQYIENEYLSNIRLPKNYEFIIINDQIKIKNIWTKTELWYADIDADLNLNLLTTFDVYNECFVECEYCKEEYVRDDTITCHLCDEITCYNCKFQCDWCSEWFCEEEMRKVSEGEAVCDDCKTDH